MGHLTQTYPEMADVESSTYGYEKVSFWITWMSLLYESRHIQRW
jgi:hypothetical protein